MFLIMVNSENEFNMKARLKVKTKQILKNAHHKKTSGGRCLQGNRWLSPPASMTSRLASGTFKMSSKVFIEETDKNV